LEFGCAEGEVMLQEKLYLYYLSCDYCKKQFSEPLRGYMSKSKLLNDARKTKWFISNAKDVCPECFPREEDSDG